MYLLYGITYEDSYRCRGEIYKNLIAKFSTRELAYKFVQACQLVPNTNQFKRHSPLGCKDGWEIEEEVKVQTYTEESQIPTFPPQITYLVSYKNRWGSLCSTVCSNKEDQEKEFQEHLEYSDITEVQKTERES